MRHLLLASTLAVFPLAALAADTPGADRYRLDPSHSQILFSYNHVGFSTTYGMFSGFEGEILFDTETPAASSVSVSMPVASMFTGWEERDAVFLSRDMIDAGENALVSFTSTSIEVTGAETARITGDLTLAGVTREIVLDARLNKLGPNPTMNGADWAGFDATATLKRSDFGLGLFAPLISDEVELRISIEAEKIDG